MRNNLYSCNARLLTVSLAATAVLFVCGCSSMFNGTYADGGGALPTDKIKVYFLPRYGQVENDSPEWKAYEELTGESVKFLGEQKEYFVTNAGYISKEALGKSNALMEISSSLNPVAIAESISGSGLGLQEKAALGFVNKEFAQSNREDFLVMCIYAYPQYPCRVWGGVSPYPKRGAVYVYSLGVSQIELGYVLIDPVKKSIVKRRKIFLTRNVDMGAGNPALAAHWKFSEEQNVFLEKAVGKLFNEFPLIVRRPARPAADEPFAPELSSVTPISTAKAAPANDAYTRLARWQADKKGYKITIEPVDGRQWSVAIDPKDAGTKKSGDNLNNGNLKGDWADSLVKDGFFHGQANKADLEQILETFLNWADDPGQAHSGTSSSAK
jgi:Immunity protein 53